MASPQDHASWSRVDAASRSGEQAVPAGSATAIEPGDRPDAPLGALLFRAGLVPEEELREALEHSIAAGRRLGAVLLERGLVEERDLTRILASQKGLPYFDLDERGVDPESVRLLPAETARRWSALPIALENGLPVVAIADPADRRVFGEVTEALGRKPRFVVAVPSELAAAIDAAYADDAAIATPAAPEAPPGLLAPPVTHTGGRAQVVVVLSNGDRVEVSQAPDQDEALEDARRFVRVLDERVPGAWPLVGGRFLRPEAIVSVDVVEL